MKRKNFDQVNDSHDNLGIMLHFIYLTLNLLSLLVKTNVLRIRTLKFYNFKFFHTCHTNFEHSFV